jgi:hypothetical protein
MPSFSNICLVIFSLLAAAVWTPARADASPAQNKPIANDPDDRIATVPTNWWTFSHQSLQDVSSTLSAKNARIIDISIEQLAPSATFTTTYVENTAQYYKPWAWYAGIDAATLAAQLTANNARLTVLKAYDAGGGQIRFVAVMIVNSGKDARTSSYLTDATPDQITAALAANNARLTQLSSYVSGGRTHYAAVGVSKAAHDPNSWWYTDIPAAQVTSLLTSNNARLIDLDYNASDGNYNAIMIDCAAGCPASSFYTGQTQAQLQNLAAQNGGRIIDTTAYPGCGDLCLSFILVDNSVATLDGANAATTRVAQLLRAGGINGMQGLYLKQVGGPVLANLEESFVYEPASSIKVLAHLFTMNQVQNGSANLTDSIPQYTNGPTSCPDPAQLGGTETVSAALQQMMWHSDNARTREITDTFGAANINTYAASIGMTGTALNHIVGCGGPVPDQLTLADAGTLYEGVASGSLLTAANQATFYSLMAGKAQFAAEGFDFTHLWDTDIPAIVAQAAPAATAAQLQDYLSSMNIAYKAGSYVNCSDSCGHVAEYYSISGWARISFCDGPNPAPRDYVFGIFLHGATDNSYFDGKTTLTAQNFLAAKGELLREPIVAGLTSCGLVP